MRLLRIESPLSGIIMSLLLASAWVVTVFSGQLQGMELFGWLTFATCVSATVKLILAFILMNIGMSYPGALSALLFSNILTILICLFPLRRFIVSSPASEHVLIKKEAQAFLLPVAVSSFCCIALVAMDMILVKRYFIPEQAGIYSYAQFIGKIFYFLPGAISIVILPHSSNLDARKEDTIPLLKRSLFYTAAICLAAFIFYNIFDGLALKAFRLLNPGITPQVISLGRLFGISMSFFAMLSVLISYFISRKDARFIKFLVAFTVLQCLTIIIFHKDLFMVQTILCLNAVLLLAIHLLLAFAKRPKLFVCSREALNLP
jgi:O-antigen/teichoic acid export membrane protein